MPNTTVTKAEFQAQVNQNALVDLSYSSSPQAVHTDESCLLYALYECLEAIIAFPLASTLKSDYDRGKHSVYLMMLRIP